MTQPYRLNIKWNTTATAVWPTVSFFSVDIHFDTGPKYSICKACGLWADCRGPGPQCDDCARPSSVPVPPSIISTSITPKNFTVTWNAV